LLANVYLHYSFDLWVNVWRRKWAQGEMIVIRFADDSIAGFQYQTDADRFLVNVRERLGKFGRELHPDKTRRIEFGKFAEENRKRRGEGKPETFDFLGFKHISGKNRLGRFTVRRTTIRKCTRAKLGELKQELRRRMHDPVPETGARLKSIVHGYFHYAVPGNLDSLAVFRDRLLGLWWRNLRRRSQQRHLRWTRMLALGRRLVTSTVCAPSLSRRSLRRESSEIRTGCANERPSGSGEGVASTRDPYSDLKIPSLAVRK
jgi:RNA-directed DNA polymerase